MPGRSSSPSAPALLTLTLPLLPLLLLLPLIAPRTALAARDLKSVQECVLFRTTYHPSALEAEWTANVAKWADSADGAVDFCLHVTPHTPAVKSWQATVNTLMADPFAVQLHSSNHSTSTSSTHKLEKASWFKRHAPAALSAAAAADAGQDLLSHFAYHYQCGALNLTQRAPIEPLFGSLRSPLYACGGSDLSDKTYLLLQSAFAPPVTMLREPKVWIFDLGASTYTEGSGGASQQWFVETYQNRGFNFDGYYGWEVSVHPPKDVLSKVPKTLLPHYIYFNVPAVTDVNDQANPLNMMKAVAQVGDFVVLKLDIDNAPVELEFVKQILADPSISSLIDEFFFEHHVNFGPMNGNWNTHKDTQYLHDSYAIFAKMRQMGIRAHGWV